jgi:PIN domain nuclease of toxin-antitoxin system
MNRVRKNRLKVSRHLDPMCGLIYGILISRGKTRVAEETIRVILSSLTQALLDGNVLAKGLTPEELDAREVLRRAVVRSRPLLELRTKKVAGQRLASPVLYF